MSNKPTDVYEVVTFKGAVSGFRNEAEEWGPFQYLIWIMFPAYIILWGLAKVGVYRVQ